MWIRVKRFANQINMELLIIIEKVAILNTDSHLGIQHCFIKRIIAQAVLRCKDLEFERNFIKYTQLSLNIMSFHAKSSHFEFWQPS